MGVPHCLKPQNILKISFIFVLSHSFKSQDSCSDLLCLNSINIVTSFSPDYPVLKTSITFFFQGWLLAKHPSTAAYIWFIKQRFYKGLIGRKIYRATNFETKLYKYWKKFTEYIIFPRWNIFPGPGRRLNKRKKRPSNIWKKWEKSKICCFNYSILKLNATRIAQQGRKLDVKKC